MGKVNVYLSDELEAAVRAAGLSVSAVCQSALQRALLDVERLRTDGQGTFTPRLAAILHDAKARCAAEGRDVTARDLLASILQHGENLGARAIAALGVDLPPIRRPRRESGTGRLAAEATNVLVAAYKTALDMRHNYIGTEHVVIALASEASPMHDVFAGLGITDRLLRQQIERLIANPWTSQHLSPEDTSSDPGTLARLDAEVQRLAAELNRIKKEG